MGLEDNISVVALLVSLIALILTLLSVTQAFLATADGYRHCGESVLGPWTKFRHRRWIWLEFRYETKFITPEILLVTGSEIGDARNGGVSAYRVIDPELRTGTVLDDTVHEKAPKRPRRLRTASDAKDLAKFEKTLRTGTIGRRTRNLIGLGVVTENPEPEMQVSWLRLLKELHGVYRYYWPQDCKTCRQGRDQERLDTASAKTHTDVEKGVASSHQSSTPQEEIAEGQRTDVAIIYRSWTWDFLPNDVVKPLAISTVGDIVVLARRLGMQWRTLKLSEGIMQADGNGFSLSSTGMKNLGTIFTFKAVGKQGGFPRITPSILADKLLCGILPGDPDLVRDQFPLVRDNRESFKFDSPGGVFEKIDLRSSTIDKFKKSPFAEPVNETLILMTQFLPLDTCQMASFHVDGTSGNKESIFLFWEGRVALYSALKARIENCPKHTRIDDLKAVLAHFEDLVQGFHNDFFCVWEKSVLWNNRKKADGHSYEHDPTGKLKKVLIQTCRRIFDDTTSYFKKHRLSRYHEGRTWYNLLVGAHIRMVIELAPQIFQEKFVKGRFLTQDELFQQYSQGFPHLRADFRGVWIVPAMVEYVRGYAVDIENGVRHPDHGIAAFFSQRGLNFLPDSAQNTDLCEALWWMLMVRGVTWTMSCRISRYIAAGSPVPPIYYEDKTPVWIV